jgi:hypothetical protein
LNNAVTSTTTRRPLQMWALAVATLVIAACSSAASSPDEAISAATTLPTPTSSTKPAAVGPVPPSTVAGQTTVASTIALPIDPAVEVAVKKGVQDFFAAYMACGQAPAACHPADFHSPRGTAVGQGTVYFQGLAARGEYFSTDLRDSYIVTQSVGLDDASSAVTFSCWYDASILLGPPGTDGQPTVLNDKIISVREKQELYLDGTEWKVGEAATVQDLGDGNQCPPADAPA